MSAHKVLTAAAPVAHNARLRAGSRGSVPTHSCPLLEKPAHQRCERITECVTHANGWRSATLPVPGAVRLTFDRMQATTSRAR